VLVNHNLLLAFLSELQSGDWRDFRAALQPIADSEEDFYPTQIARNLSAMGHVEFTFDEDRRWTVCPPTLACLPTGQQISAVLCGARNHMLLEALNDQADRFEGQIEVRAQPQGPDVVFVTVRSMTTMASLATELDLTYQLRAAEAITHCLPALESYTSLAKEAWEPLGYKIEKFDIYQLQWQEETDSNAEGLYRYYYYIPEFRLRLQGKLLRVPHEIGIYMILAMKQKMVLTYDVLSQTLSVPVRAPLPALFARAATLCFGVLPGFKVINDIPTMVYQRVPPNVAHALMSQLGQDREITK
jgi:hypothetical protein